MNITRKEIVKEIPNKPFAYEFFDDFIIVYSHSLALVYSLEGSLITRFEKIHGRLGAIRPLPNDIFSVAYFGNKIYNHKGEVLSKKFKATKKSIENTYNFSYNPTIDKNTNEILVGFRKGGLIGIYDFDLKPLKYIELEKDEILVNIDFAEKQAIIHNVKKGLIYITTYPVFEKKQEYKIDRQNEEFILSKGFVINFGYTSNLISIDTRKENATKFQFHPTSKKGYKEQYEGTHNFGTTLINYDEHCNLALFRTDKNKCVIYDIINGSSTELKVYEKYNYNQFNDYSNHLLYYGFFKDGLIYTNIGKNFVLWNKDGKAIFETEDIEQIKLGSDMNFYSITNGRLDRIEIKE